MAGRWWAHVLRKAGPALETEYHSVESVDYTTAVISDDYITAVIKEFPQYLRIARLKNGSPAVARITKDTDLPDSRDAPSED